MEKGNARGDGRKLPVYFISDLHLGASYIPDPKAHERRAAAFVESLIGRASELIMLGDVLDYWYEYRNVAPRGYLRFFGALARLADSGVKITWFIGNHDIWLFDYLRDEIGLEVVDGVLVREILGKRFLLTHGDGVGRLKPFVPPHTFDIPQPFLPDSLFGHTSALDHSVRPPVVCLVARLPGVHREAVRSG